MPAFTHAPIHVCTYTITGDGRQRVMAVMRRRDKRTCICDSEVLTCTKQARRRPCRIRLKGLDIVIWADVAAAQQAPHHIQHHHHQKFRIYIVQVPIMDGNASTVGGTYSYLERRDESWVVSSAYTFCTPPLRPPWLLLPAG